MAALHGRKAKERKVRYEGHQKNRQRLSKRFAFYATVRLLE
jgi:hypothetical protein